MTKINNISKVLEESILAILIPLLKFKNISFF